MLNLIIIIQIILKLLNNLINYKKYILKFKVNMK